MAKALDGRGLDVYYRELALRQEIQEMIARIHASKPGGDLYRIRGSTALGIPSKKMGDIIRAESRMVEFPSILELERRTECEEDFSGKKQLRALFEEGDIQ